MLIAKNVERFLDDFKLKMSIYNVMFLQSGSRIKNTQTLAILGITQMSMKAVLNELTKEDYVEGPLPETQLGGIEMWVFGKELNKHEIYIKITMGQPNQSVICISFHIAEHPMIYPLKNN